MISEQMELTIESLELLLKLQENEKLARDLLKKAKQVKLNVGGTIFQVHGHIISAEPKSKLFDMVKWHLDDCEKQKKSPIESEIFLDRDPKYFSLVLYFLINHKLVFPAAEEDFLFHILLVECEVLDLSNMKNYLIQKLLRRTIMTISSSTGVAGTQNTLESILDGDEKTGIVAGNGSSASIYFEFPTIINIKSITVCGYKGAGEGYVKHGNGAQILYNGIYIKKLEGIENTATIEVNLKKVKSITFSGVPYIGLSKFNLDVISDEKYEIR